MRLEIIDQGRFEKVMLIDSSAGRDINGRTYIGGYHFNCGFYEEIWFDGLAFEWMKVSNPFVDIQIRSH